MHDADHLMDLADVASETSTESAHDALVEQAREKAVTTARAAEETLHEVRHLSAHVQKCTTLHNRTAKSLLTAYRELEDASLQLNRDRARASLAEAVLLQLGGRDAVTEARLRFFDADASNDDDDDDDDRDDGDDGDDGLTGQMQEALDAYPQESHHHHDHHHHHAPQQRRPAPRAAMQRPATPRAEGPRSKGIAKKRTAGEKAKAKAKAKASPPKKTGTKPMDGGGKMPERSFANNASSRAARGVPRSSDTTLDPGLPIVALADMQAARRRAMQ